MITNRASNSDLHLSNWGRILSCVYRIRFERVELLLLHSAMDRHDNAQLVIIHDCGSTQTTIIAIFFSRFDFVCVRRSSAICRIEFLSTRVSIEKKLKLKFGQINSSMF